MKSMMGEQLDTAQVMPGGLLGDRAYALVDPSTGKVVSAKNPRKWPNLFSFRAAFTEAPQIGRQIPPVRITLPDGTVLSSGQNDLEEILTAALGRKVTFESIVPEHPNIEEYWPDIEDLDHRDTVTDEPIPPGAFFDGAAVHLLTTATLESLQGSYPQGRFDARRFRPNVVVASGSGDEGFVENGWIGRTLAIGAEVRLSIQRPCPRCVMTTLPQGDLPQDRDILRTAVQTNQAHVGVYASVVRHGTIRRGDSVSLLG